MNTKDVRAIAIVGLGCILPDAPNPTAFWHNLINKRYSITEVPPERWSAKDYYDPDPLAPDKTYSKIGGWVRGFEFDWKQYRLPPRVANAMDQGQQWAVTIASQALADYGYPDRPLDLERTGVIMGTAMGGEMHYLTALRVAFPEYANALQSVTEFSQLPREVRDAILSNWHKVIDGRLPPITEDSMPGELANIVSGRVANLLNLRGPNFITDAACAASLAAIDAAVELLSQHHCDAIISGGVDRNMGAASFVKFCKIGALSATGTRPFGDGADGFVMGEGSAAFLLKRLGDAERDGDKIYAVIRGVGGSSDGKGKGITAPNPIGQVLAVRRAWENAGLDPATATLVEAHGTSTKVGDVVEVESLSKVFSCAKQQSIALGSVKSNIGHLKGGAGAAGLLKATLALYHKVLPPTLHAEKANPNIDFTMTPFYLNRETCDWPKNGSPRRLGVSAYGFGGTNFHCVLEEHVPGMLTAEKKVYSSATLESDRMTTGQGGNMISRSVELEEEHPVSVSRAAGHPVTKSPVRGVLAIGAQSAAELKDKLDATLQRVQTGWTPQVEAPGPGEVSAPERLVIDFGDQEELIDRLLKAQRALGFDNPQAWKAVQAQGIFRGSGAKPGKIAFLFPGQGSQYLNMGRELAAREPIVAQTFKDGDDVMTPILGKPLSSYFFVDSDDPQVLKQGEFALMQTAITQPAMLTMDTAFFKLLGEFGFKPDMVMGHSLGEYAALIAAGVMPFADALEATAARGAEMTKFSIDDNGWMAAVLAPLAVVEQTLSEIDGYVVAANINSSNQAVIGGASQAVEQAIALFNQKGFEARRIPVSHAFHTKIVAPAGVPLREVLNRLRVSSPQIPIVANVTGEIYPTDPDDIREMLQRQVASPVQWVKGLNTLYANGVRTFVEVGPKKALKGFVDDVLGSQPDVVSLFTNHPKMGELPTFNQALCGLYAAGYALIEEKPVEVVKDRGSGIGDQGFGIGDREAGSKRQDVTITQHASRGAQQAPVVVEEATPAPAGFASDKLIAHLVAQALQQVVHQLQTPQPKAFDRNETPLGSVVISGTGLGLPGAEKAVMDPDNALRILRGEQFVDLIPERFRKLMLKKQITRLVKSEDGSGHFEIITDPNEVIKLAGRAGRFDLHEEYGVPEKLVEALDITSQLAMAAGLDALREAGIPLVQTYKKTTTGRFLPDRWLLPEALRDETGVIFASAFPGGDRFADELTRYYIYEGRLATLQELEDLRRYTSDPQTLDELNRRILDLREVLGREPYIFDRRFLFRLLSMGHSQFAEYIGARGPNTQVNAACASTTQAIALAEDWIRSGRCRRVIVIGADNVTSDTLLEWVGAGFLASGAGATDDRVEEAALPFDRRRHGTLMGMGACALVIESEDVLRERGMRGLVELLSSEYSNSAFHGTRLDVEHIASIMNNLMTSSERRFGLNRFAIAPQTVFMSHETFTPARGGSAAAEVFALRQTFGSAANDIVVANTKGFTGHPMGVGVEDVIAAKILEYGIVPPVPNYREVDPDLGTLNLSRGGRYNVQYAIHLAAGFGSQIAMTLTRRIPGGLDRVDNKAQYQRWLANVSGYDRADTEVVKRVLRVVDQGAPIRQSAPSSWPAGTGPMVRAASPGDGSLAVPQPVPLIESVHPQLRTAIAPMSEPVKIEPFNRAAVIGDQGSGVRDLGSGIDDKTKTDGSDQLATEAAAVDVVKDRILAIVAEKTGYPPDMLDLDLDLEADLGVDTVKQAETFAAIRGEFDIPRRDDLKLRDYPTLNHVIGFVYEMRPDLKVGTVTSGQAADSPQHLRADRAEADYLVTDAPASDVVKDRILAIVAEKTGYPPDMLDLDLDLEADLGVDTVKQAETFAAIRGEFDIPRRDDLKLRDYPTLNHVIGFVYEMRPDLKVGTATRRQAADSAQHLREDTMRADHPVTSSPNQLVTDAPASDVVKDRVLAIVAEKTGYPPDMLDLDLDLEADLGVDTVKQAETFAAIRGEFDIPRRDDLKLRDYPTLNHVIGFVYEMRPDLKVGTVTSGQAADSPQHLRADRAEADYLVTDAPASDVVKDRILAIVAEKTGYPPDMLDLDLDLEADLGVDTVKQAETFAAIRGEFDIPRRDDLKLRDYPTLNHVIGFVYEMRPDLKSDRLTKGQAADTPQHLTDNQLTSAVQDQIATPSGSRAAGHLVTKYEIEAADRIPRRVPVPVLRPMLELCKSTGIALDALNRVLVMLDNGGVGRSLVEQLQQRGATVLTIDEPLSPPALEEQIKTWLAAGPIDGVYWLPALDEEPAIDQLDLTEWRELNRVRVKNLYTTMRVLYEAISKSGTFLIAATRLGGLHGYDEAGATAPLGGAVVGFTKAYKRERGDVLVKAVDFAPDAADVADALIAETLRDPGVLEVGYHHDRRFSIGLAERSAVDGQSGMTLDKDTIFVITGAAGGITSEIVTDLAAASGGVFYLLDLASAPEWNSANIRLFRSDKEALKQKLIDEMKAAGEKPTPVKVEKQLFAIERSEAALRAMEAVEAAGGTPIYYSVNLLDAAALDDVIDDIRQRYHRIDVLLHAGGVEISRSLADKEPKEFDLVFDVKAEGLFNILHAANDLPIGAMVSFSSVAGRFGNAGQTDYSAANDLLCKLTSNLRRIRPNTRAIVIDWTAWGSIGMATRGSIPKIMEAAGIDMLPPEAGVPTIRRELTRGGTRGEIVVAGRLGPMLNEFDETGGLDAPKVNRMLARSDPPFSLIGVVKAAKLVNGLEIETTLDPKVQPFLFDHQMEGRPLLPGVMGVEAFAQIATLVAPGYTVAGIEHAQFESPFKFYRMQPRTLYLSAVVVPDGDDLIAHTTLRSITPAPKPDLPPQEKIHFTAQVRLSPDPIESRAIEFTPPAAEDLTIGGDQIYRVFFHGPAYQVIERARVEGDRAIGLLPADLPPNTSPANALSIMSPRLVEACFQLAGVWKIAVQQRMALPFSIGSATTYRRMEEAQGRLYAVVMTQDGESFDAQLIDEAGRVYVDLKSYRTVALPGTVTF